MRRKILYTLVAIFLLGISAAKVSAQNVTSQSAQTGESGTTKLGQQIQIIQAQKREAINASREDIALIKTQRDVFKTRLQTIKDQKKKLLVERIDARIAEVNKNQTSKFSEDLISIQGFLDRMRQIATDAQSLSLFNDAQNAISTAKNAVDAQAAKTYTMTITEDAMLRLNGQGILNEFRQDINSVYKLVIDAKQKVQESKPVVNNLIKKEATGSAQL